MYDVLDWDKIRHDFRGIVIAPYMGDKIWHLGSDVMNISGPETAHEYYNDIMGNRWKNHMLVLSEWYRHWNCSCGVIWDIEGISECSLIKEISFESFI